jgi:hypothetical protein
VIRPAKVGRTKWLGLCRYDGGHYVQVFSDAGCIFGNPVKHYIPDDVSPHGAFEDAVRGFKGRNAYAVTRGLGNGAWRCKLTRLVGESRRGG